MDDTADSNISTSLPWPETIPTGRLTARDGVALFDHLRFHANGFWANRERERRHGADAFYNINRHLNYSNTCAFACRFCAFGARRGSEQAWTLSLDRLLDIARRQTPEAATELHIVGGAHPDLPFDFYVTLLKELKKARPQTHLKAFSAVEIVHLSERFDLSAPQVLERLRSAGLDSLPGGGAEIFAERVRRRLCPDKAGAEQWLSTHREAHRMGLRSNATILFGHIETPEERVDHLLRLRDLQDETGGFQAIIPLKFQPANTALEDIPRSGGVLDLQVMAACRLILDNFSHVKAYWPALGLKTAQTALWWGADDLDGAIVKERIYHSAGVESPEGMSESALRALIEEAGRRPVERDSLYEPVRRC